MPQPIIAKAQVHCCFHVGVVATRDSLSAFSYNSKQKLDIGPVWSSYLQMLSISSPYLGPF